MFLVCIVSISQSFVFAQNAYGTGEYDWAIQFGSTGGDTSLDVVTDDNNIYVVGFTNILGSSSPDIFIHSYPKTSNPSPVWTHQFGTPNTDAATGVSVDSTGIYVVGYTDGDLYQTSYGFRDAFIQKYDLSGNVMWTRQFGTPNNDQATGVSVDSTGIYVVGYTNGELGQTLAGSYDTFIQKYDLSGNLMWTHQFGTPEGDFGQGISVTSTGVYVTGTTSGLLGQDSFGQSDGFVKKYDFLGNLIWTDQFGTSENDFSVDVFAFHKRVYVAGLTFGTLGLNNYGSSDAFVRQYVYNDGSVVWTEQYGTALGDAGDGVYVTPNGVYVTGNTFGLLGQTSFGQSDSFVSKYNEDMSLVLAMTQFGTSGSESTRDVAVDSTGIYVTGNTNGVFPGQVGNSVDATLIKIGYNNMVDVDTDEDGISNQSDECPLLPETVNLFQDADGCPDTEPDNDGITYPDDQCPLQPETVNQFEDDDGCPDTAPNDDNSGGGCLIATAAYGTELAPQIQLLREVRDNTVLSTTSGTAFMTGFNTLYYSFAPTVADWERENPIFKESVRAFITPMISTLSIMTLADDGSESEVLGLGMSVIALNLAMYIAAPVIVVWQIKRRIL